MKRLVVTNGFNNGNFNGNAKEVILHELELVDGNLVPKRYIERKYRRIKKLELEDAAMELMKRGKIEILKEEGGRGRPAYFFAKGANYGN